jgi:hypothetical protein
MLAYYLEWHMRQGLAPMLFEDADKQAADALRTSVGHQAHPYPAQSIPVARAQLVASSTASSRSVEKAIQQLARFPSRKLGLDQVPAEALEAMIALGSNWLQVDQLRVS